MKRISPEIRSRAIKLRKQGLTYSEISEGLGYSVPKSTLNYWFRGISMDDEYYRRIDIFAKESLARAQIKSAETKRAKTTERLERLRVLNRELFSSFLGSLPISKLMLVILYWTEGGKNTRGTLEFGNSDPNIIAIFLFTLRKCYLIDENKFRVTLQCRADSDIKTLEKFWRQSTGISHKLFYKAQIDPRTVGKPTLKKDYKGVCRITYFSADIFNDIIQATQVLPELIR